MIKINVGENQYIASDVKHKNNKLTLIDAAPHHDIICYIAERNANETKDYNFVGNAVVYAITEFSAEEKLEIKIAKLQMKRAKEVSVKNLENKTFFKFMGK
jgi:hypothetical protein